MNPPPRPAGVVAAAVLLIVVGADLALPGLAVTLVCSLITLLVGGGLQCCLGCVGGVLPLLCGLLAIFHGVALLRGRLREPSQLAFLYLVWGLLGCVAVGCVGLYFLVHIDRVTWDNLDPVEVGAALFAGLNVAAVVVAAVLLARGADGYELWARAMRNPLPPDDRPEE